jgi:hypothetical protein
MAFGPGDVVNNRYRILDKLGAGAHGMNDRFQSVRALWTSLEGLLAKRAKSPF